MVQEVKSGNHRCFVSFNAVQGLMYLGGQGRDHGYNAIGSDPANFVQYNFPLEKIKLTGEYLQSRLLNLAVSDLKINRKDRKQDGLLTTFSIYRWSFRGGISALFFCLSVFNTPTAAQCTSPEINVTRIRFVRANICSCSMNQLRSFYDAKRISTRQKPKA